MERTAFRSHSATIDGHRKPPTPFAANTHQWRHNNAICQAADVSAN